MRLTQAAYARHVGVSRQAVTRAIKDGRIKLSRDGKVDPATADADWLGNTRPDSKVSAQYGPHPVAALAKLPAFSQSKAAKAAYDARKAKLEAEQLAGLLVAKTDVASAWSRTIGNARQILLAIPDELSDILAYEADPIKIREKIRDRIDLALSELAGDTLPVAA